MQKHGCRQSSCGLLHWLQKRVPASDCVDKERPRRWAHTGQSSGDRGCHLTLISSCPSRALSCLLGVVTGLLVSFIWSFCEKRTHKKTEPWNREMTHETWISCFFLKVNLMGKSGKGGWAFLAQVSATSYSWVMATPGIFFKQVCGLRYQGPFTLTRYVHPACFTPTSHLPDPAGICGCGKDTPPVHQIPFPSST